MSNPHSNSLPLFVLMQRIEGQSSSKTVLEVLSVLEILDLDKDLSVEVKDGKLVLLPLTEYGKSILKEVDLRKHCDSDDCPCEKVSL